MELFRQILEAPLKFPAYVKDQGAIDILSNLLDKIPELRLGAGAEKENEIKHHSYFKGFDFDPVAGGYMDPPWKPNKEALRAQWEKCDEEVVSEKSSDLGDGMSDEDEPVYMSEKEKKKWEWCEDF